MIFDYLINLMNKGFTPRNILDIGANFGNFSMRCKQTLWLFSNYYLIEANEECKFRLSMTGFPNIFYNLLGSEDDKIVTFYKTKDAYACTGNSYYREKTKHYADDKVIMVNKKMITLDTLFKDKNVKFDFAKLDTQGSELDIIKGGLKTLTTCKYLLLEVSTKYYNEGIPLKNEIVNFMKDIEYNKYEVIDQHMWEQIEPVGNINMGDIFQEDIIFYK